MASTSKVLSGAGTGAAAGTAIMPGWGTVIGGAVGAGASMLDNSDEQAMDQLRQNQLIYSNLNLPRFDRYTPGTYNPQTASAQTIQEDPGLRSQQQAALMRMGGLAQTGLSDVDNQGFERARQMGDQMENSGNAAALQNAQARGIGGSGLEFAMHEQANADAANRANQAGLDQAATGARQRAMYQEAYGNALSGMRGQDFQANAANAGILNNFAQFNTNNQNQANQWNVANQNQAAQYNNNLKQQSYNDQYNKAAGQAGQGGAIANGYFAQGAANQSNMNGMMNAGMTYGMINSMNNRNKTDQGSAENEGQY